MVLRSARYQKTTQMRVENTTLKLTLCSLFKTISASLFDSTYKCNLQVLLVGKTGCQCQNNEQTHLALITCLVSCVLFCGRNGLR